MDTHTIIGVYVGLVCGYGLILFLDCLLVIYMSMVCTEALATRIINQVGVADLSWVEKQNKIFMAIILSRVHQFLFRIMKKSTLSIATTKQFSTTSSIT